MIVKDDTEEVKLRRALNSVAKYVDGIFLTTTAEPNKRIKKVAKEYGANWSHFKWIKDFSAARNYNFSQVPKEYDWCLWIDCDDVVIGGEHLHRLAHEADMAGMKSVFARYLYSVELDEKGGLKNILLEHLRERLTKNDGSFEWVGRIHETQIEKMPTNKTDTEDLVILHLSQDKNFIDAIIRNVEILEQEVIDKPTDPRPKLYLAKAYHDLKSNILLHEPVAEGMDSITMELLKQYVETSGWAEERVSAYEYMAMIYQERGEHEKAMKVLAEAITVYERVPSLYIQMALTRVYMKQWADALHWVKLAAQVESGKTTLVQQPKDYKAMILEVLYHVYLNTNHIDECLKVANDMVELSPTQMSKERLLEVSNWKEDNEASVWIVNIARRLRDTGQEDKIKHLIKSIPPELQLVPALMDLRRTYAPVRKWKDNEIMLWCGPGFEKWSPKNTAQGIGGSEEAVIYLSQELTTLGWKVTVYGDPREDAGDYEGVSYRPFHEVNWRDEFNIVISWRQIGFFDANIHYNKAYLWNHDIQNQLEYTPNRTDKVDKVFFLTEWHRQNVPDLGDDKIMITANGITV